MTARIIRVFVPLDGTAEAEAGFRTIVPLAEREEVELILFSAVANAQGMGQRKAYLDALCQRLRSREIDARPQVQVGDRASTIGRIARKANADFMSVAVRTSAGGAEEEWNALVGGARRAGIPILLTPPGAPSRLWSRMLVVLNGQPMNQELLATVLLMAKMTDAQVHLRSLVGPAASASIIPPGNTSGDEAKTEDGSAGEVAEQFRKAGVALSLSQGPPDTPLALAEFCGTSEIDLVCVTTESASRNPESQFGAIAGTLIRSVPCSVLIHDRGSESDIEREAVSTENMTNIAQAPHPTEETSRANHLPRSVGVIAVLMVLALAATAGWSIRRTSGSPQEGAEVHLVVTSELPLLPVIRVASRALCKTITLPGTLSAFREVDFFPKESGFVEWIGVDRGSKVKTGEPIVRLIAPELTAKRRESEAKQFALEAAYRRLKDASSVPGVVSQNDLDVAQKSMEAEQARVQMWKEREAYLLVTAPFDGIVIERNLHEGSYIGPPGGRNMPPIVKIQEVSHLRLVLPVPEGEVAGRVTGDRLKFTVPAYPDERFTGTLARISESIDIRTRTMPVELDVINPSGRLAPGMFAEVEWKVRRAGDSLFVPVSAIATTTERTFVERVGPDESVEWVDVKPAQVVGNLVEVFGPLKTADILVVRATAELRHGTKIAQKEITLEEVANSMEQRSASSE